MPSTSATFAESPPLVVAGPVQDCFRCLARKDDTSRFVGLTLLLSLTRQLDQCQFRDLMLQCSRVLDGRFLDRLLKSGANNAAMTELAAHITEALATVLVTSGDVAYLMERVPCLVQALSTSGSANTQDIIIRTLLALSTTREGADAILSLEDISPLLTTFPASLIAHQAMLTAFLNWKATDSGLVSRHLQCLVEYLASHVHQMDRATAVSASATLDKVLKALAPEILPSSGQWVNSLYEFLRTIITSGNSSDERTICIGLAARLLDVASPEPVFSSSRMSNPEANTSTFLFMQLVTIDLRAGYPKLAENMHSTKYEVLSSQQSDRLDVLCKFLVYLVQLDDLSEAGMEPDLALQLRGDIRESMAMTIEFLRDWWDSVGLESTDHESISGLHGTHDSNSVRRAHNNPLMMTAIQTLSIWLNEEDSLHKEATTIIDVFLTLWSADKVQGIDCRHLVLCSLQALMDEKEGRRQFLIHDGWTKLWKDIRLIYENADSCSRDEILLAVDTARLTSDILRLESVGQISWAQEAINVLEARKRSGSLEPGNLMGQLQLAILHLASSCYIGVRTALGPPTDGIVRVDKLRNIHKELLPLTGDLGGVPWVMQCVGEIASDLAAYQS